ncbi:hypothetical protein [Nitrosopumilus oxyclinae]|uniref:hypothetical protein n=1 Tax=Nitrosopumilus oxyclinae TaxID=1959104 RepID=UPI0015C810D3|nr:hypothetical protein [Nitrosopumilus oxyclinae]
MKMLCKHCGKAFEGNTEKFCSDSCFKSHISDISRRSAEAVEGDPGHTQNLSED